MIRPTYFVSGAWHGWMLQSAHQANTIYAPDPTPEEILNHQLAFFDKHL